MKEKGKKRILYSDDSAPLLELFVLLLELEGYFVIGETDPIETIHLAHRIMPDLIITDRKKPKMDGFKMAKTIKSHAHLAHIPILLCSAYVGDLDKHPEFYDYFCECLHKPFGPEELLRAVEMSMAGKYTG